MDSAFPSVTTLQCVNALLSLGYEIADYDHRVVTLVGRDGRRVFVRRHCTLSSSEIQAILIVASISRETFVEALARRGSQMTLADPPGGTSGVRDREGVFADVDELLQRRRTTGER